VKFVEGIHHVGLTVADLDRSLAFYRDVLGFELLMRQEKVGGYFGAIVGYPDCHVEAAHLQHASSGLILELTQYRQPELAAIIPEPARVGNAHLCLLVGDLEAAYDELVRHDVDLISPPVTIDTGVNAGSRGLYFRDPDGITLELFELLGTAH
jgi:catechol 2,3-dioxygenase-like lactoylglutathione lyase family enzyme